MAEHTSPARQRVDRVSAREDHDRWQGVHPLTGEEIPSPGIPVLQNSPVGQIMGKTIRVYTIKCPDCFVAARFDNEGVPLCPDCGLVCAGDQTIRETRLVRDAKAAGRIDGESEA